MGSILAASEFVKRQTKESGFSHFDGTWEELTEIVIDRMKNENNIRKGYKDGVILVSVPATGIYAKNFKFYSAIVDLHKDIKLDACYSPRLIGEAPFIRVAAKAKKQVAKHVEIVCYRADVLEEDSDRSSDAEWEIICIKARTSDEEEPMDPYTMARNFLHMKGGTKGSFTSTQFAESIIYWNNHTMCAKKHSLWSRIKHWLRMLKGTK